jgi:RNA polymerase sigma factor (sigma-70 family)
MSNSTNKRSELRLISKIKNNNCNESFSELSSGYDNFYYSIARKYYPILNKMGMSMEEIKCEKEFVLHKAVMSFKHGKKVKFSSWFCNCVKYHFLNYINSNKKFIKSEDRALDLFNLQESIIEVDTSGETFAYIDSLLSSMRDKRVKDIYQMRYFSDDPSMKTWSEIGKKLQISTQTAINLHERARVFLRNKMESKNFCDLV